MIVTLLFSDEVIRVLFHYILIIVWPFGSKFINFPLQWNENILFYIDKGKI